uniref:Uncharacterized protein n=1 Tax=Anopheles atroparvus TaxID=41427 RepID=A0A182JIF3_ANOAO
MNDETIAPVEDSTLSEQTEREASSPASRPETPVTSKDATARANDCSIVLEGEFRLEKRRLELERSQFELQRKQFQLQRRQFEIEMEFRELQLQEREIALSKVRAGQPDAHVYSEQGQRPGHIDPSTEREMAGPARVDAPEGRSGWRRTAMAGEVLHGTDIGQQWRSIAMATMLPQHDASRPAAELPYHQDAEFIRFRRELDAKRNINATNLDTATGKIDVELADGYDGERTCRNIDAGGMDDHNGGHNEVNHLCGTVDCCDGRQRRGCVPAKPYNDPGRGADHDDDGCGNAVDAPYIEDCDDIGCGTEVDVDHYQDAGDGRGQLGNNDGNSTCDDGNGNRDNRGAFDWWLTRVQVKWKPPGSKDPARWFQRPQHPHGGKVRIATASLVTGGRRQPTSFVNVEQPAMIGD